MLYLYEDKMNLKNLNTCSCFPIIFSNHQFHQHHCKFFLKIIWWTWQTCWNCGENHANFKCSLFANILNDCSTFTNIWYKNWTRCFLQKSKYTSYIKWHIFTNICGYFANIYGIFAKFHFSRNPHIPKMMHFNATLL